MQTAEENHSNSIKKRQLRRQIRSRRAALTKSQKLQAQTKLARQARRIRPLWQAKRVLSYSPFEGEISPESLIKRLPLTELYLPKITSYRKAQMQFLSAQCQTRANRYGIQEPQSTAAIFPNQLDVILVPLVAFDAAGNRLGMGAGFYDRALKNLVYQCSTRPLLIGLAYSFQEVKSIPAQPWDVPLDAILTDVNYIPISSDLRR